MVSTYIINQSFFRISYNHGHKSRDSYLLAMVFIQSGMGTRRGGEVSKVKQILDDKKKRVSEIIKTHYFEERQLSHDEIMDLLHILREAIKAYDEGEK